MNMYVAGKPGWQICYGILEGRLKAEFGQYFLGTKAGKIRTQAQEI